MKFFEIRSLRSYVLIFGLLVLTLTAKADAIYRANGETGTEPPAGWTLSNVSVSTSAPLTGTKSYRGGSFRSGLTYSVTSPSFTVPASGNFFATAQWQYAITQASGTGTWTMKVTLVNVTNSIKTVIYTTSASTNINTSVLATSAALTNGKTYQILWEATTTNTTSSSFNFVKYDELYAQFLASIEGWPPPDPSGKPYMSAQVSDFFRLPGDTSTVYGAVKFHKTSNIACSTCCVGNSSITVNYRIDKKDNSGNIISTTNKTISFPWSQDEDSIYVGKSLKMKDSIYHYEYWLNSGLCYQLDEDQFDLTGYPVFRDGETYLYKQTISPNPGYSTSTGACNNTGTAWVFSVLPGVDVDSQVFTDAEGTTLIGRSSSNWHNISGNYAVKFDNGVVTNNVACGSGLIAIKKQ